MKFYFYAGGWFAVLLIVTILIGESRGEELKLYPALTVSEIYDDNLFNDPRDRVSEYVTRIMPSIAGKYEASRIDLDLGYTLDYRYYLKGERGNEAVHFLDAKALATIYRRSVFLEVKEELARVSLDAARDFREESLFINQSDRNLFSMSPYFEIEPTASTSLKGGYRYVDVTYEEGGGQDRSDHVLFLEGTRELTPRTSARFGYQFLDEESEDLDHRKQDAYTGLRSQFSETSVLFGTVGYTWIDFSDGNGQNDIYWDLGATRDFQWFAATVGLGVRYTEDPEGTIFREEGYRLSLSRDWTRTRAAFTLGYTEYFDTDLDDLDTRRFGGSLQLNHELTSRWNGLLIVSGHQFDDAIEDTETRRWVYHAALSYLIATDFTGTLAYTYIDSHSPELEEDRFRTNRIALEVRKVF